jgi:hypothetical protein
MQGMSQIQETFSKGHAFDVSVFYSGKALSAYFLQCRVKLNVTPYCL